MENKSRSFQKRIGNGFYMNGPLTSGGLTYKESNDGTNKDALGNAVSTDINDEQINRNDKEYS